MIKSQTIISYDEHGIPTYMTKGVRDAVYTGSTWKAPNGEVAHEWEGTVKHEGRVVKVIGMSMYAKNFVNMDDAWVMLEE